MRLLPISIAFIVFFFSKKRMNIVIAQEALTPDVCTDNVRSFTAPSTTSRCMYNWTKINNYTYPTDFKGENGVPILSKTTEYVCGQGSRKYRMFDSNGIPDHDVVQGNNNPPCEVHWIVQIPFYPKKADNVTELPPRSLIGIAMNGVPAFGPQEVGNSNAIEFDPEGPVKDAGFWYGHATAQNVWHFHNPYMGHKAPNSTTLLGYALDGFPIYGPLENETQAKNLDDCNGWDVDGKYQYHIMRSDWVNAGHLSNVTYCEEDENGNSIGNPVNQWNYILGCYRGSIDNTNVFDGEDYIIPSDCRIVGDSPTVSPPSPPTPDPGPNIIIFQPDDLKFYDNWSPPPNNPSEPLNEVNVPNAGLPHINRLREEGVEMTQAYTASPACGTSRFSTLTGRYASRAKTGAKTAPPPPKESNRRGRLYRKLEEKPGLRNVVIPTTKLMETDCTQNNLASLFQRRYYRTAMFGKWHLSTLKDENYEYDVAQDEVKECGFDVAGGLYSENLSDKFLGNFNDGSFSHNMEWVTHEAIEFMKDSSPDPFFMYFNPTVPHGGNSVAYALNNFTCSNTPAGNVTFNLEHFPNSTCAEYREYLKARAEDDDELGPIYVDDSLGALLGALNETGKINNTLIIFQQDHGMETKMALYENGIRIAQFVWYPGKIEPGTFDKPVSTIDVAATVLDFAGIQPEYMMDGISWKDGVIKDSSTPGSSKFEDRCLFFEMEYDRSVRCGCDKYLHISKNTTLNNGTSSTDHKGRKYGYSTDEYNLYDLCGGGASYVTSVNQESYNEAARYPLRAVPFTDLMECHIERTSFSPPSSDKFKTCPLTLYPTISPAPSTSMSPSACPSEEVETLIEVKTDKRAEKHKNKYKLYDNRNNEEFTHVVHRKRDMVNSTKYSESICLPANFCYMFFFTDRNGDGICCENGKGYYKITYGGNIYMETFDDGKNSSTFFGNCTSPPSMFLSDVPSMQRTRRPLSSPSSVPSIIPSGKPSSLKEMSGVTLDEEEKEVSGVTIDDVVDVDKRTIDSDGSEPVTIRNLNKKCKSLCYNEASAEITWEEKCNWKNCQRCVECSMN